MSNMANKHMEKAGWHNHERELYFLYISSRLPLTTILVSHD